MRLGMGMSLGDLLRAGGSSLLGGLTHYWPLDEASGSRSDRVGGITLTDNNTVGSALYKSVELDASVHTRGNVDSLNAGFLTSANATLPASFTIAMWATRDIAQYTYTDLFLHGTDARLTTTDAAYMAWFRDGQNVIGTASDGTVQRAVTVSAPFGLNTPTHFLYQYDSATKRCRVAANGTFGNWSTALSGTRLNTPANLSLGGGWSASGETRTLGGQLMQPLLWDRVLSDAEVAALYNAGSGVKFSDFPSTLLNGLVSRWPLTENAGETRNDAVGSLHMVERNVAVPVGHTSAKNGSAASFVLANGESLSATNYSNIFPATGNPFTLALWLNASAITGNAYVVTGFSANKGMYLYRNPAGGTSWVFAVGNGTNGYVSATRNGALSAGWHLMIGWWDAETQRVNLSVDGEDAIVSSSTCTYTSHTTTWRLHTTSTTEGITGLIDEVAVWSRVLTAAERTALYNSGAGKFYPTF